VTARIARAALVASLAAAALLAAPAAPAGAKTKICKNTYGGDLIAAKDLKCKKARRIVRAWAEGYKGDGDPDREALGFTCKGRDDPHEGLTVTCTDDGRRVRFYANVP
jgi:hypothetical protein